MIKLRIFQILLLTITSASIALSSHHFEIDTSWPDESIPNIPYYGSGIVLDMENNIIVLHRSNAMEGPRNETIKEDVVFVIDRISGKILRQWGRDKFYHPHGIEVAKNGDIFITDSRLHQVFKFEFEPDTKLWREVPVLTLGVPFEGGNDTEHFCTPADVAIEHETENFYVADGYCNRRVVKFDKNGNFLLQFTAGSTDFNIVHALTIAVRHSQNTFRTSRQNPDPEDVIIFVADRDNCRIQSFDSNGNFLYEITAESLGIPSTMMFSVAHVNVDPRDPPYNENVTADYGIVYAVNGALPDVSPQVFEIGVRGNNASVLTSFITSPGDLFTPNEFPHDLTVSKDGTEVYVVMANSSTLTLRRFRMSLENGAGHSHVSGICFVLLTYLSSLVVRFFLQ